MVYLVTVTSSSTICGLCNGTGCPSCRGSGEVPISEWECRACGAAGEGVPACCDECGCDNVEDDRSDNEPDFDPYDYEPCDDGTGYYY